MALKELWGRLSGRASEPLPDPAPVREPPNPIPLPPDLDEPEVEEPPDSPAEEPPAEDPGSPVPVTDPPVINAASAPSATGTEWVVEVDPADAAALEALAREVREEEAFAGGGLPTQAARASPAIVVGRAAAPEPVAPPSPPDPPAPVAGGRFFGRLRAGLHRSTQRLTDNLSGLFTRRPLDEAALEELEETLIAADLGVAASRRVVEGFRRTRFGREVSDAEVRGLLADELAAILAPFARPLVPEAAERPFVVLVAGVNGTGKTTTIAKLAETWRGEGRRVMLAAGDTFRAAAVEQLQVWGERTGCPVVAPAKAGADAAGLAHDALERARAEGMDVLLIDTAGRLHNKAGLMEELRKMVRVLRKRESSAPHAVLLVLDATTGQNALQQVRVFREMVDVTGLVVTKLDGSAKGGVVVALAQEFALPVHAVGVGEQAGDLRPFDPRDFARSLVGLEQD